MTSNARTTRTSSTPAHLNTRTATLPVISAPLDAGERFSVQPTRAIRKPKVAKHEPRLTDGIKHPVTVRRMTPSV